MTPDVQIIIVSFNTREDLSACLESLRTAAPACLAGIVVVDNASTDGSADLVRARFPDVTLIALERNAGFGAANNVALKRCGTPLALLLNSDTRVPAGAIDALRERLLARDAVAAGPRLLDAAGHPEVSFGRMLTPIAEAVQQWRTKVAAHPGHWATSSLQRHLSTERYVDWVSGACMLLSTSAVRDAGFFDERFFMYEEDVDLCAALRARNGRILFAPSATVTHLRGRSVAGTTARAYYDRSHLAFYEKHSPAWAPLLRLSLRLRGRLR